MDISERRGCHYSKSHVRRMSGENFGIHYWKTGDFCEHNFCISIYHKNVGAFKFLATAV